MSAIATSPSDHTEPASGRKALPNSVLGMVVFVLTEMMFFGALISAYLIVKSGNVMWPPPDQPRLPITLVAINTLFLCTSGVMVYLSNKALAAGDEVASKQQLLRAIFFGAVFVFVQGYEWMRMLGHGLTMTSSTYGSFFYMIIGCHAVHVCVALGCLMGIYRKFAKGTLKPASYWGIQVFWYFVVGVWPILYVLVYLS